jgi:hypothetical protein
MRAREDQVQALLHPIEDPHDGLSGLLMTEVLDVVLRRVHPGFRRKPVHHHQDRGRRLGDSLLDVAYWLEVGWREDDLAAGVEPYLDHDEEKQAFYAPDGKLILSREYLDFRAQFECLDAAIAEERGEGDA